MSNPASPRRLYNRRLATNGRGGARGIHGRDGYAKCPSLIVSRERVSKYFAPAISSWLIPSARSGATGTSVGSRRPVPSAGGCTSVAPTIDVPETAGRPMFSVARPWNKLQNSPTDLTAAERLACSIPGVYGDTNPCAAVQPCKREARVRDFGDASSAEIDAVLCNADVVH